MYARKTIVIWITILTWAAHTCAQPIYFDNFYGADTVAGGVGTGGTVKYRSGYFSWGSQKDAGVSHWRLHGFEIDTVGGLISEIYPYTEDTISERTANVLVVNDSLLVGLSFQQVLAAQVPGDIVLTKMKRNGEIIWKEVYGLSDRLEIPQRVTGTVEGGFIIAGQVTLETHGAQEADAWLVKTDSLGIVEWEQTYGGLTYDNGSDVLQTPDGGFLLLGWTRSFGAGQRDFYLVKTDSLGEQQWQRTYGGGGDEGGKSIMLLSDGNYLLTGSGSLGSSGSIGRIYKVTPEGSTIWSETYAYPDNSGNNLHRTVELSNGDLVSTGLTDRDGFNNSGYLIRTDSEGEVIWQREYDKNEQTDLFYSVLATEDGGFLLSGQAINEETNSQDAWLLKVDSIGCPYPNCTVGIDEVEKTALVDVWPNPVSDVLNIEVIDPSASLSITAFDMQGRSIPLSKGVPVGRGIHMEDVSTWPSGMYILQGEVDLLHLTGQ